MPYFLFFLLLVLGIEHFYIFARLSHYLGLVGKQKLWVGGVVATLLAALYLSTGGNALPVLVSLLWLWLGISFILFVVLVVIDLLWLLYAGLGSLVSRPSPSPERRVFIKRVAGVAALGATGLLSGAAVFNVSRPVAVKPVSITVDRWPAALDGLRIVQLTDVHISPLIDQKWTQHIIDTTNALEPDIIALTGDFVDGSVAQLRDHIALFAQMKATIGVYFVTGNHEYYSDANPWCEYIASLGIRVLRNERVTLYGKGGAAFDLAGVDDWRARHLSEGAPDLGKALAGRDLNNALILLAHQPAAVDEAAAHGVDLQLSGHTHGGQIWPFGYLVYLQQPYVSGLHRYNDSATQIYVSEGTGYWGPAMRLGTTAEIAHITLRSSKKQYPLEMLED